MEPFITMTFWQFILFFVFGQAIYEVGKNLLIAAIDSLMSEDYD